MAKPPRKLTSLGGAVRSIDMRTARPAPKIAEPFYRSVDWRAVRASLIATRGRRCEACGKTVEDDGSAVRLIADHVIERRDGGPDLDPGNLRLVCVAMGGNGSPRPDGRRGGCHNAKTASERHARMAR